MFWRVKILDLMCMEQKAVVCYVQELLRVCILPFFFFFFCGSYFLLLTRVLYLEPPSYWMMASSQREVWLKLSKAHFNIFSLALICGGPLLDMSSKQQMHFPLIISHGS